MEGNNNTALFLFYNKINIAYLEKSEGQNVLYPVKGAINKEKCHHFHT